MKRYAIWNRTDPIITPIGEILTPEQWISRHPIMGVQTIVPVVAAGEINGAFMGTLGQLRQIYESMGAAFVDGLTNQALLEAIEDFEDSLNTAGESAGESDDLMDILLGVG